MTDLPFGRGGSPLQNLIIRGFKETVISAIKCEEKIDSGPIYLKKKLIIDGNAEKIFINASKIIQDMITAIIKNKPLPKEQKGEIVKFSRREPTDGDWTKEKSLDKVYDCIRMLDAESYPSAYIIIDNFKLEFTRASLKVDSIIADVKISKR